MFFRGQAFALQLTTIASDVPDVHEGATFLSSWSTSRAIRLVGRQLAGITPLRRLIFLSLLRTCTTSRHARLILCSLLIRLWSWKLSTMGSISRISIESRWYRTMSGQIMYVLMGLVRQAQEPSNAYFQLWRPCGQRRANVRTGIHDPLWSIYGCKCFWNVKQLTVRAPGDHPQH